MLWLIFAVLTAVAVACVLWPLAKSRQVLADRNIGAAIYKAQLAEIERDVAQRIVTQEDALSARAEAARRLLSLDTPVRPFPASSRARTKFASLAVAFLVPALSLTLYAMIGHPEMRDAPLAARLQASPERIDLAAAVAKVEAHLAQHPEDGRGYEVLAPIYLRIGRAGDAVNAARTALHLLGESPVRQTLYGEAMVVAANGMVTSEARQAFEAAAAQDSFAVKPRFFLGLFAEQQGNPERARAIWSKLASEAPPESRFAESLRIRIAALAEGQGGSQSNPFSAADQMNSIRAMVDALAARLAQNGHDLEGWLRLVRSYSVLRESDKARLAIIEAKRNHASDATAIGRIDALARELGLEG